MDNFIEDFEKKYKDLLQKTEFDKDLEYVFGSDENYRPDGNVTVDISVNEGDRGWILPLEERSREAIKEGFSANNFDSGEFVYSGIMLGQILSARKMFIKGYAFRKTEELLGNDPDKKTVDLVIKTAKSASVDISNPTETVKSAYRILNFLEENDLQIDESLFKDLCLIDKENGKKLIKKLCSDEFDDGIAVGAHTYFGYSYRAILGILDKKFLDALESVLHELVPENCGVPMSELLKDNYISLFKDTYRITYDSKNDEFEISEYKKNKWKPIPNSDCDDMVNSFRKYGVLTSNPEKKKPKKNI